MLSRLGAGEKAEAPETHLLGLPLPACALWERTVLPGVWGPRGPGPIMGVQSGPHRGTNNGGLCVRTQAHRPRRVRPHSAHLPVSRVSTERGQEGACSAPHSRAVWTHCTRRTRKVQRPGGQTGRQSQGCRAGRATAAPELTCWDHWNQPDVPSAVRGQQDTEPGTHRLSKPRPTRSQSVGKAGPRVGAGGGPGRGGAQAGLSGS